MDSALEVPKKHLLVKAQSHGSSDAITNISTQDKGKANLGNKIYPSYSAESLQFFKGA